MATVSQITEAVYRARFDDQITAGAEAARKSVEKLGVEVAETDEKVTRSARSGRQWVNSADEVTQAARRAEKAKRDLANAERALNDDLAKGEISAEQSARALTKLREDAERAETRLRALNNAGASAAEGVGLTRREIQALSPQLIDFSVQMAGGQGIFLPLIQQGPQAVDAVGGFGRAISLLGQILTPARIAVGAFSAAIAGSLIVAEQQDRALAALSNRLQATRGDYDSLARSVNDAARAAAATTSLSTGDARAAGAVIAGSRDFAGSTSQLRSLIELSDRLATVMGTDAAGAASKLAEALSRPTKAAQEMADAGLRGMNESLLRSIERLENQGKVSEAARLTLDAYRQTAEHVAKSPLQEAFDSLSQSVTRLWQQIQPLVEWVGDKLANALAWVVTKVSALIDGLATMANKVRELLGFQIPDSTAASQRSATELALERARQIGGRYRERQDVQDQMAGLRAGLPGASAEEARLIGGALRELQERYDGLRGPVGEYLLGLSEQARLANVAGGAARDYAQAEMALEKVHASAAEQAEARRLVTQKLIGEAKQLHQQNQDDIEAQRRLAAAYDLGGDAVARATAEARARSDALKLVTRDDATYEGVVKQLTDRYLELAQATQAAASRAAERGQKEQLDLLRAEASLVSQGEQARTRELAMLRERQKIVAEAKGDEAALLTDTAARRIANAGAIADETAALQRQKSVMQELSSMAEQVFDRIGQAITQAFVEGKGAAVNFGNVAKGILSQVLAYVLRIAVVRPLGNWLTGSNQGTVADLFGGGSGATGTAAMTAAAAIAAPAAAEPAGNVSIDYSTMNLVDIPPGASAVQAQRLAAAAVRALDPADPDYYAKQTTINNAFISAIGGRPQPAVTETPIAPIPLPAITPQPAAGASPMGALTSVATLAGGMSSRFGLLGSAGEALGLGGIGSSITGTGGLLQSLGILSSGTAAPSIAGLSTEAAMASLPAMPTAASAGTGLFSLGTVGGALGGVGVGFGAGMLTSSLVGRSRGTVGPGGTIGAGAGALIGTAIGAIGGPVGMLIGGAIGGALGGAGGAMFGPTKKGMASRSGGDVGYGIGPNGQLIITGSGGNRWDAAGSIAAVQGQLDAINAGAAQRGLLLNTAGGVVGFGAASSNPSEINLAGISVSAPGGSAAIQQAVAGAAGRGPQAAFDAVDWVRSVFEKLTQTDRVSSFKKSIDDLNGTYDQAIAKARELGVSEADLVTQRDARLARLMDERNARLSSIDSNLAARQARAAGNDQGATLIAFDATAAEERRSLVQQFFDLGLEGTKDAADRLATLEQTLAAERLKIVKDFADQATAAEKAAADQRAQLLAQQAAAEKQRLQTARGLFEDLTIGGLGGLAPETRYFSGVSALNAARQAVLGDPNQENLSDFVRLSQSVLPVARDYLGTSERYASIVADVASTLRTVAPGSDPANLGALLESQANGTDRIETAILATGNANAMSLQAVVNELRKLTAQNEALLRRVV